jgi:hypothetical protein
MYENVGKYWSAEEDVQFIKEYNIYKLKFSNIIIIHKRPPRDIEPKLKSVIYVHKIKHIIINWLL